MNQQIKNLKKNNKKEIEELNKKLALHILEHLKNELKKFNLKNQSIQIEYSMGGIYLTVNGKDFQRNKTDSGWREGTWHQSPMFNSWKAIMKILNYLNSGDNENWAYFLDKQYLTKKIS